MVLISIDPRTGESQGEPFHESTAAEVQAATRAAAAAFATVRTWAPGRFAALLEAAAQEMEALGDALIAIADAETALGRARLESERARTCAQLRMFAGMVNEATPETSLQHLELAIDQADPHASLFRPDLRRMLVSIGPVAVFGASNFPLAFGVPGGDVASAWAAGCPVVVKGHPSHPGTSNLCANALQRAARGAGFPEGMISLIQGSTVEAGHALVLAPEIQAVGFTGSLAGGRALFDLATRGRPDPIPVYAEMGSLNPLFVLPAALAARASEIAHGFVESLCQGSGQFCTKPGLVLVVDGPGVDIFKEAAAAEISASTSGQLLNGKIQEALGRRVGQTSHIPQVRLLAEGHAAPSGYTSPPALFVAPAAAVLAHGELQEEHFGPVAVLAICDSVDELLTAAAHLSGSLTATVHGDAADFEVARPLLAELQQRAGRLIWNGFPTGVPVGRATVHGGPYPATTSSLHTSVGTSAIRRFLRPVCWQNMPEALLPVALRDQNPLHVGRAIDGHWTATEVRRLDLEHPND